MERSTCFTTVADGFGWFAVLVVFLFFLIYNGLFKKNKRKMGGEFWEIFFLENPLKFPGSYFIQGVIIVFQLER